MLKKANKYFYTLNLVLNMWKMLNVILIDTAITQINDTRQHVIKKNAFYLPLRCYISLSHDPGHMSVSHWSDHMETPAAPWEELQVFYTQIFPESKAQMLEDTSPRLMSSLCQLN